MNALTRDFFLPEATEVAPRLLGVVISHATDEGEVSVRITEVEAYLGDGTDPGSHAHRGKTARNWPMFGEPGHLYAYFTYGMHVCANLVCSPDGRASGVLIRAGEVVAGQALARARRGEKVSERALARGPACLVKALGIQLGENGSDLFAAPFRLEAGAAAVAVCQGPRTGLKNAAENPWRFWVDGDATVSAYKRHPRAAAP